ncbi:MAG: MFS transporter [Candidatus Diapherotrites archaeon]|nr:MFS transporter [Candidatus Diapherotrites archaeon]
MAQSKIPSKRNIYLLGLVSFINDIGSKMILPILPLFVKSLGGSGLAVGLIGGLGETIAALLKVFAGHISDKIGKRKPFVFFGYGIAAIAKLLLGIATVWPHVLILRSIERLGKGVRQPARDALLAASTTKKARGRGFGIHRAFDSGGAILGSLLALILFWSFGFGFREIFIFAGLISMFSLLPAVFIKEPSENLKRRKAVVLSISLRSLPRNLKAFILIASIFALANFSYMFFILRSEQFFTKELAVVMPILMYAIYNTIATCFAVPAGVLSDKVGRKRVLIFGYALFALVSLSFIYVNSLITMMLLFFLYGLFFAFVDANERAFVSDMAPKEIRATALGTFQAATGLALLPAGVIAGLLWDSFGFTATFFYGFLLALIAVLMFIIFDRLNLL